MNKPSAFLLGSKPGSVAALSVLIERGWDVRGVVAAPQHDRPWVAGQSLREFAGSRHLPVWDSQADLPKEAADFVISYMFRSLVKADTRSLARRAAVNFHPGPLPEFGGWAFYNMAILEGAPEYGCTCHVMDDGFDTGPLLAVRRFEIDAHSATAYSLERRTQEEMVRLFVDFCRMAEADGELQPVEQDKAQLRYVSRQEFEALKEIPDGADEETIDRYARAFWYPPFQGAFIRHGSAKIDVIPQIAREQVAPLLHANDLAPLLRIAKDYQGGASSS